MIYQLEDDPEYTGWKYVEVCTSLEHDPPEYSADEYRVHICPSCGKETKIYDRR